MAARRVRCPECTVILDIPADYPGRRIRCSVCKADFLLPGVSDDDILDWIATEEEPEDTAHGAAAMAPAPGDTHSPPVDSEDEEQEDAFSGYSAGAEGLVLLRVDSHGALFEFPAGLLEPLAFRAALPRKCLRCGTRRFLTPHMVIFGPMLKDCTTLEAEFLTRSIRLEEQEIRDLSTEEVLRRLPGPENLPAPANLPMIYWVCDLCSPAKLIYAQNRLNPDTHEGRCCLQIHRLSRAEEFLRAVGGEGSEAHRELLAVMEKHPETPWDNLPGMVQQRIQHWFAPHRGERFVAYCPDRSRTRKEDGMAGVLVSTRRLIYHTALRHHESEKGESLELSFAMDNGRQTLRIQAPLWEVKNMVVDKEGLRALRQALTEQRFPAQWQ